MNKKIINRIFTRHNIFKATRKCFKGIMWKKSASKYKLDIWDRTDKLYKSIINRTYSPSRIFTFTIRYPKKRDILSVKLRDRIVQRVLNDTIVMPLMSKSFIADNYACQVGKGTDRCREKMKKNLHAEFIRNGNSNNFYVAQFDIAGYYPNMDHKEAEKLLKKKLPKEIYKLVKRILHHQYKGIVGYNPGSQLIQIIGVSLLDALDHYIKEKLHIKYYVRFMDDFILIHESKEYLEYCKQKIEEQLAKIKATLNTKKSKIFNISKKSLVFLGFVYRVTKTGKVLMNIDPKKVKEKRHHMKKYVNKVRYKNYSTKEKVDESFNSWMSSVKKGNTSKKLIKRLEKFYEDLWK